MQDLTESKPERTGAGTLTAAGRAGGIFPVPRPLGFFVILVTVLAFIAGWLRNELALTLLGTVFLIMLVYCFLGILLLFLFHRRKAKTLSMVIVPETVSTGKEGELFIKAGGGDSPKGRRFWRLPAILIRCELFLTTRDGRVIHHYADPDFENYSRFPVKERGAYYSAPEYDRFVILDAAGFFRFSLPLPRNDNPRLLALPLPAEEAVRLSLHSGGTEQRNEPHYRKSDELTDHRPYIPGDDPRRINWKLYSHAPLGDLFVREGESEPPPHSRLLILIDTEADLSLYTIDEARRAVDLLCENALAAALEFSAQGMDIHIGCTGGKIAGDKTGGAKEESGPLNAAELAAALAWPAAVPAGTLNDLPNAPMDRGVIILALPRTSSSSSMDRFLKKREGRLSTDIVFLYNAESKRAAELEAAARVCVNLYNGKSGIHAVKAAITPTGEGETK